MTEIQVVYEGSLRCRCIHTESGEEMMTDAPKDNQGKGEYFSPTDLVAVALGSCVLTLMGIQARRLGVNMDGSKIRVSKEMENLPHRRIKKLHVHFTSPHQFNHEVQTKLEKAGRECPVHHSLHPEISQTFIFEWGGL